MFWKLFLGKHRDLDYGVHLGFPNDDPTTWTSAADYDLAVYLVQNKFKSIPNVISFDHDLGSKSSGLDFAKWLIKQDLDETLTFPKGFVFAVHSRNPARKRDIEDLVTSYIEQRPPASDDESHYHGGY